MELHWGDLCFTAGDDAAARVHYDQSAEILRNARSLLSREEEALAFFGPERLDDIDRLIVLTGDADPRACVGYIERAKAQELLRRLDGAPIPSPPGWPDLARLLDRIARDAPGQGVVLVHYYVRDTVTAVVGMVPGGNPVPVPVEVPAGAGPCARPTPGINLTLTRK